MLVLIPGLACTPDLFSAQLPALWRLDHVMIINHAKHRTMSALARDVLAHAPPTFSLAGLSMGGYAALEIMRQAPGRVRRLALMNTSARPDSEEATVNRRLQIAEAHAGRLQDVMRAAVPNLFHQPTDALTSKILEMTRVTGVNGFENEQEAIISRADSRPLLSEIKCPTLVLAGSHDKLTPPALLREIHDGIRGSRYLEIPICGHVSALEQPTAVTDALVEWLSR